ncbi:MAG: short-chain fatty acid transporter, partial [Elusimicrobia bacterium]|nr:short-chain fatty acid transporter [Elusimicrobiota bacterium]
MNKTREYPLRRWLARAGVDLSDWFERWFPDAFTFGLIAVAIVFAASVAAGDSPGRVAGWFGAGYWELVKFTMQMVMIIVSGYAVATSPPVYRLIRRMAGLPTSPPGAVAFVALFSMLSSLFSWSFSLIFSGLLAREVAHRVRGADYRALGAAAYLGLGSVWALGLSSSAALLMASRSSMPAALLEISGAVPLEETILLWQSLLMAGVLIFVSVAVAYGATPSADQARGPESLGVQYRPV